MPPPRARQRRVLPALVLVVAALAAPAPVVGAPAAHDWVLITLTAGPAGAENFHSGWFELRATRLPHETMVWGEGVATRVAGREGYWFFEVGPTWGDQQVHASTSRDLGGVRITAYETALNDGDWREWFVYGDLEPNESYVMLHFFAGGTISHFQTGEQSADVGSIDIDVVMGSGSRSLRVGQPDDEKAAATAGPIIAGFADEEVDASAGLVGGFVSGVCVVCEGSWTGPAGSGSYRQLGTTRSGVDLFAGPAGAWRWRWTGIRAAWSRDDLSTPGIPATAPLSAAFAPIGDAWTLFARPFRG